MGPSTTIITITPQEAKDMLGRNAGNRKIAPGVVRRYAEDMADRNWDLNGESIKVASDGSILDGQHRLEACVLADAPFETLMVMGLDPAIRATVDTGKPRRLGDYLRWNGESLANQLAAAITLAWKVEAGKESWPIVPTRHQAAEWLDANPDIREALTPSERVRREIRLAGSVITVTLFGAARCATAADLHLFVDQLSTGLNLSEKMPAYALRRWAQGLRRGSQVPRVNQHAMLIKAWNGFIDGQGIEVMTYRPGGANPEQFPVVHGPLGQWPSSS